MALDQITTGIIKDDAVTTAKMAGGTDGKIISYDASGDPVAVGPGTDGQVLTSTGAGSPPAFEAVPSFDADAAQVFNESGADVDFRIESDDNANMLVVDGGTDRVGIGIAAPVLPLDVRGNLAISNAGTSSRYLGFYSNASTLSAFIEKSGNNLSISNTDAGDVNINTNDAQRINIASGGDVTVTVGNLKMGTSGKGIDFSATSDVGGMASELLDDYEEGTWTPATAGGQGSNFGRYIKIGTLVYIMMKIYQTSAGSGNYALTGLPFSIAQTSSFTLSYFPALSGFAAGVHPRGDSTTILFGYDDGFGTVVQHSSLSVNKWLMLSGTYMTT